MKKLIIISVSLLLLVQKLYPQGCIPVRSVNGFGQYNLTDNSYSNSKWQLDLSNRYFKSFRDFKESTDQKTPAQNQFVNKVYTFNIAVTRILLNGWSLHMNLPITANSRTSSAEHGGLNTTRHSTHSFGIGDMRVIAYKWLLPPADSQKFNIQLGLGIKLPTGDYKVQDYFYRDDTTKVLSPINPGIQLGDGGTGIITELNTFYVVNKTITFYGNFYYLINPREQNGVAFTTGRTPSAIRIKSGSLETSVPDFYSIRVGGYINAGKLSFSLGIRDDGSPVHDLFGGSNGDRRAGHNISVEPGIIYKMKTANLYAYVPIIVGRRIEQNVPDKFVTQLTGVYTVSAGGAANYMLFAGISFKFPETNSHKSKMDEAKTFFNKN